MQDVGQGGASPRSSGEAEPALGRQARRSLALGGRARRNQSSVVRTRNAVAFSSDWKCQRSMVISSTSLGTPVLGPRQHRRRAVKPPRHGATKSWVHGGTEASVRRKPEARRPHRWITG